MGNLLLNAIFFGIVYTDKGKKLANEVAEMVIKQAKTLLKSPSVKEAKDGEI